MSQIVYTSSLKSMRRIVIIGNGIIEDGLCGIIDRADIVIRFNEPVFRPSIAGTKTDILFAVSSGQAMQRWVSSENYLSIPYVASAREIILPFAPSIIEKYHPQPGLVRRLKGRRSDWTREAVSMFAQANKLVSVLPDAMYYRCCEELQIDEQSRKIFFPSTGFIAIQHCLQTYPSSSWRLEICGFTWEGWKRHNWQAEKGWVEAAARRGQMNVL